MSINNPKTDFFIESKHCWARVRSCAIIIEDDCVLMVTNQNIDFYYSVGGAIQINETSADACIREVFEETGLNYEIDRLVFIHENFFAGFNHDYCHEIAFYYLMKPIGKREIKVRSYALSGVLECLSWIPLMDLSKYKAYPQFFATELLHLTNHVKHIVDFDPTLKR